MATRPYNGHMQENTTPACARDLYTLNPARKQRALSIIHVPALWGPSSSHSLGHLQDPTDTETWTTTETGRARLTTLSFLDLALRDTNGELNGESILQGRMLGSVD